MLLCYGERRYCRGRGLRLPDGDLLFRHVLDVGQLHEVGEAVEVAGVLAQEKGFVVFGEFGRFADEVVGHAVGDGGDGARVIGPPHELVHTYEVGCFADGTHGAVEGVELVVEEPGDAARLDHDVGVAGELDLLLPLGAGDHAEVADGNLQIGTLLYDLFHLGYLQGAVGKVDGEDGAALFHEVEELHHLVGGEPHAALLEEEALGGYLEGAEAVVEQLAGVVEEVGLAELAHAAHEEAGGVAAGYLHEVVVLDAVDKLLGDDGGRYLGVVHVGEEDLGAVYSVDHEGGHHLAHLAHEEGAAALEGADGEAVDHGVLLEPQVGMCIDYHRLLFLGICMCCPRKSNDKSVKNEIPGSESGEGVEDELLAAHLNEARLLPCVEYARDVEAGLVEQGGEIVHPDAQHLGAVGRGAEAAYEVGEASLEGLRMDAPDVFVELLGLVAEEVEEVHAEHFVLVEHAIEVLLVDGEQRYFVLGGVGGLVAGALAEERVGLDHLRLVDGLDQGEGSAGSVGLGGEFAAEQEYQLVATLALREYLLLCPYLEEVQLDLLYHVGQFGTTHALKQRELQQGVVH